MRPHIERREQGTGLGEDFGEDRVHQKWENFVITNGYCGISTFK